MSGLLLANIRNPWLLLGLWLIGGVIALCGALVHGELGVVLPQAGGEYLSFNISCFFQINSLY
ncbi:MAG: hypothetical protein EHM72_10545 [Calditrichaeota bacterium]|nr:MAG: hypothetical protein EHM72_10545 [Calditrichota bacterium]